MNIAELLRELGEKSIKLRRSGSELVLLGDEQALDARLVSKLRVHKETLLALIGNDSDAWWSPPVTITPEMVPLVRLTTEEIERIVGQAPGGAANVQDIYPLAPLQEGILFHHLLAREGDPYLTAIQLSFASRGRLEAYLQALRAVIGRNDILRTAVMWEGLAEPVQVVLRQAALPVVEVELDPAAGDVAKQLYERFNPRRCRIDVRRPPLIHAYVADDAANGRWVLLLLTHHLISDHTSKDVMQEELEAHLLGQADHLPAPIPFRNFVAQARLGVRREEHEEFFHRLLGDLEEPTTPFGLLDVTGDGVGIDEALLDVDASLARRIRECSRKLGVSGASLFHLAWALVLARTSGRDDVVFGTVLVGRMQGAAGSDRAMGLFNNTLPVRISVGEKGVEASVRRTQTQLGELMRHEHASLSLAQRCSAVPPPTPLFSALLNYRHNLDRAQSSSAEAKQAWEGIKRIYVEERTNYPLVLSVDDLGQAFELRVQAPAVIGPMRVCQFMHTALVELVQSLEMTPTKATNKIDVLPKAERQQVLVEWNRTEVDFRRDYCLHELIEEQIERTPDGIAVVFEETQLTYRELNERANQLARYLRGLGVGPDTLVGICVERSLEMVVGLLGILKAGGAYVPLDPEYPKERLAFMLEDAAVPVLLTEARLAASLPTHRARTVWLDADWPLIAEESVGHVTSFAAPEHLAYMIYTSGSTGRPKGAMNTHAAIVNRLLWMQDAFRLTSSDRVLQKTPFSFDVSVWEFFWPLLTGATLVVALPGGHKDGAYLVDLIRKEQITNIHFVPSMLSAFLEQGGLESSCASLKRVICSGEGLPFELQQRFFALLPTELHNLYGPTEAAVDVTYWACERESRLRTVPIGRPIANTQIRILDRRLQPTPIGVPGELHIGGIGLARGYRNLPELTAEKFIPDPFRSEPGARLYKTGDLARYLPDGAIEYLGRLDHQVKIRGFRIELGEIESVLAAHPAVREVVAVAREDDLGDKRLATYLTVKEGYPPKESELRGLLRARLPEYMIPSAFVILDRFPLTPNGKVDRKALPKPDLQSSTTAEFLAPNTHLERALASIWCQALRVKRVGLQDNFFELGGHSLLAVRVIAEISKTLNVYVSVPQFFQNPTVEKLVQTLGQEHHVRPKPQVLRLRPGHAGLPLYFIGCGPVEMRIAKFMGEDRAIFGTGVPMPIAWRHAMAKADPAAWPTMEQLGALHGNVVHAYAGASPCALAGYSFQGKVVIEAARAFQRAGGNLALVLLIDSSPWTSTAHAVRHTVRRNLGRIWLGPATRTDEDAPYGESLSVSLCNSWRLLQWLLRQVHDGAKRRLARVVSPNAEIHDADGFVDEEGAPVGFAGMKLFFRVLLTSFHPRPLDAAAVLFRTSRSGDALLPQDDLDNGWGGLFAQGLEIIRARGDHWSLVKDERDAAALARQISAVLDRYAGRLNEG